ncbi:MAG: phosphomethylpyrimidine synthase [Planctomycetes bacterium SM23_32]|nr:MAG: phosphomethylpyrimidine synthase [Planctomycetes bacterium SM23_32]
MTKLELARKGTVTPEMRQVCAAEGLAEEALRQEVAAGLVVIPANVRHAGLRAVGIGRGLRTKVNANIGTSPDRGTTEGELEKLKAALEAGADTVMDLSTGGDLDKVRRAVIEHCPAPVGTVPIYQAAIEAGGPEEMSLAGYLGVFERHARDGVDFATVHAGVRREAMPLVARRLMGIVSRGGAFLARWMDARGRENFLYEHFDDVLAIAREYDVTMSLGDGLRPGCIEDATDEAQLHELRVLAELAERCRDGGVQVMIEGPGHVPLEQIEENVRLEKEWCAGAPFYVLGPLPTDVAPGYDHVVSAIGGGLAAAAGADFLCYVTPREHVGLPDADDVREGVMTARIAAHVGDLAKGLAGARELDRRMSQARAARDWDAMLEHALTSCRFGEMLGSEDRSDRCSMCGEFCAVKLFRERPREAHEAEQGGAGADKQKARQG